MQETDTQDGQVRMPVRIANGVKTSVSFPATVFNTLVTAAGGRAEFRKHLNSAVKEAEPRPGYSRSQAVRMTLEKRLANALVAA